MRKILTAVSGIALAIGLTGAAHAQTTGLAVGWNHVKPTNCLYQPGTLPAGAVAAPGTGFIFADVVEAADPNAPPAPPNKVMFTLSDQTLILMAIPFCKDGTAFWIYTPDGKKAQWVSIYPTM